MSDDEPERRERRKTARARRLRVPLDEVPRPPAAVFDDAFDDIEVEVPESIAPDAPDAPDAPVTPAAPAAPAAPDAPRSRHARARA